MITVTLKCDKCGKTITSDSYIIERSYGIQTISLRDTGFVEGHKGSYEQYLLCDECIAEFRNFQIESEKEVEKREEEFIASFFPRE